MLSQIARVKKVDSHDLDFPSTKFQAPRTLVRGRPRPPSVSAVGRDKEAAVSEAEADKTWLLRASITPEFFFTIPRDENDDDDDVHQEGDDDVDGIAHSRSLSCVCRRALILSPRP